MAVWAGNLWFLFKETSWFKARQESAAPQGAPQATPPATGPAENYPTPGVQDQPPQRL